MVHSCDSGLVNISINKNMIASTLYDRFDIDFRCYKNGNYILHRFCKHLEKRITRRICEGALNVYLLVIQLWGLYKDQLILSEGCHDHSVCSESSN